MVTIMISVLSIIHQQKEDSLTTLNHFLHTPAHILKQVFHPTQTIQEHLHQVFKIPMLIVHYVDVLFTLI